MSAMRDTAARRQAMSETDLKVAVMSAAQDSIGWRDGKLSAERTRALDYYYGRPLGTEQEGRSQVISTDVADVIEWILPSLLRIFAGGSEVVRFEPTGPEDEEMAKQASDYVNHIFNVDNPGFQILHAWFKDALLQKNGVVKVWWDESREVNTERYARLAEPELVMLLADPDVEPVAHADHGDGFADITVRRKRSGGRVRITPVPTDEFLISRDARDIDSARFVGHRVLRTASDLIDSGFPRALVERLPAGSSLAWNAEVLARMPDGDLGWPELGNESDPANRKIEVVEAYLRIDFDGDGIAELRQVTLAGDEVLINQPVDAVPFADLTPIPMPHSWVGRSVADLVTDLQLIKSTILRQMLDNLYLANNARVEVVQDQVNLDDLLTSRPGGIVRVRQPGAVRPLTVPSIAGAAIPLLEYLNTVRENRTGVTSYNQGLDANSLNKTATGITAIMSASQQRLELVARVFAETGVKRLFKLILRLVARHQQAARIVRLRNSWVPMDPRSWNSGMDCTVTVGLGTGNREQTLGHMQMLLQTMREVVMLQGGIGGPLVTFAQVRNVLTRYVEGMAPSGVNDAARAMMGAVKRFWGRINGVKATAGTADAQTVTYDVAPPAYVTGERFLVRPTLTTTATNPSINVNGLGAKTLKDSTGAALVFGAALAAGTQAELMYDGTDMRVMSLPWKAGSFSPALTPSSGTINYSLRDGYYFRIGPLVFVEGVVTCSSVSGLTSASMKIVGLPCTAAVTTYGMSCTAGGFAYNVYPNIGTGIVSQVNGGASDMIIQVIESNGTVSIFGPGMQNNTSVQFQGLYLTNSPF